MRSHLRLAATAAAALLAVQAQAHSAATDSQSYFLAALASGSYTETFTGLIDPPPADFASGALSFNAWAADGLFSTGSELSTYESMRSLVITFTGAPVTAVGGNFYLTNLVGDYTGGGVTVSLADGTTASYLPDSKSGYLGFTSTAPIASITIQMTSLIDNVGYVTVDNLTIGTAASMVPEPGQWLLLAAGVAALGALHRRRQA